MKFLADVPRWFLLMMILALSSVTTYAINNHLDENIQQSEDIKALTANVSRIAEAVENLKTITENNREEHRWLHRTP